MKATIVEKDVEVVTTKKEKVINLELTAEEAYALRSLCYAGKFCHTGLNAQKVIQSIYEELDCRFAGGMYEVKSGNETFTDLNDAKIS